jgi:Holliday junction resolvasome RuvABC ATP-dependent DNA helicase subunit
MPLIMCCFTVSPGLGKTSLANVIAIELGVNFISNPAL